ncbi:MAG: hypothetical protein LBS52_06280 [Dysgonamonadaceae bacterium]|jgi:hypothetical protein|nr:hypothetical protein [Dysgonamonadaceae bacterium]
MRTYKLTPLEQLQLEKKKVREERAVAEQRLVYQLQYINDNWGSLITRGISSSIKNKFFERMEGISVFDTVAAPLIGKSSNPWLNFATSNLPLLRNVAWGLLKPALMAYATKKITSLIFGKRKK